jgi:hypothetical protein
MLLTFCPLPPAFFGLKVAFAVTKCHAMSKILIQKRLFNIGRSYARVRAKMGVVARRGLALSKSMPNTDTL